MSDEGKRIEQLRKRMGLSQEELGAVLGVGRRTVGAWERGENTPRGKNLLSLASALGATPAEILGSDLVMEAVENYTAGPALDLKALALAIETLEAFLAQHRKKLAPAAKAQTVAQLYATMHLWRPEALTAANVTPLLAGLLAG